MNECECRPHKIIINLQIGLKTAEFFKLRYLKGIALIKI